MPHHPVQKEKLPTRETVVIDGTVLKAPLYKNALVTILENQPVFPVGGNLTLHLNKWENITHNKLVLSVIKKGLRIRLIDTSMLYIRPPTTTWVTMTNKFQKDLLESLLEKQAVELAPHQLSRSYYFNHFPRMKPDGTYRPIANLKKLNTGIVTEKFRMVDVNALRNAIRKHQWGVSLDLKDAYLQELQKVPTICNKWSYLQGRI